MIRRIIRLGDSDSGTTATEYGLIAAIISVVAIVSLIALGQSLVLIFGVVASTLGAVAGSGAG
ncbi:MAG: Flp family type IVb pilin [Alphaproteobacteria bacterium]|nr:Flp family type IVb pilin [Alphaproteobacteria bacterium]